MASSAMDVEGEGSAADAAGLRGADAAFDDAASDTSRRSGVSAVSAATAASHSTVASQALSAFGRYSSAGVSASQLSASGTLFGAAYDDTPLEPVGALHHLELYNFKSYKGRHVIGPFRRFSCIVGPNGAGKSNVVDAVSFVMGVRASGMRGEQLRDLVYQMEAEPEATGRTAHVTMVFVKADGEELRFKRTISASGHSVYSVNERTMPWEEYDRAMAAIDLRVKAQNFLVLQGDVEAIATKSPAELTSYIEQIAGSASLQDDYNEKQRLKETAEETAIYNHNRQKSINSEKRQYKEQKKEAEEFKKLQNEQRAQRTEHAVWQLYHINQDLLRVDKEAEQVREELQVKTEQRDKVTEELKKMKASQAKLYKESLRIVRKIKDHSASAEALNPDVIAVKEKTSFLEQKISAGNAKRAQLEKRIDEQKTLMDSLERDLRGVIAAQEELGESESMDVEVESRGKLAASQANEYAVRKEESARKTAQDRTKCDALLRQHETDAQALESLHARSQELADRMTPIRALITQLAEREDRTMQLIAEAEAQMRSAEDSLHDHDRLMEQERANRDDLDNQLHAVLEKLAAAKAERKDTEREEKFAETVAHLVKMFPGVRGRVADLCKCAQKQYDVAVSVAIGHNMDAIVTDDEKTAIECVKYLKEQRLGRATFLPLDTIRVTPLDESLRLLDSVKLVLDLVEYDKSIRKAAQYVCGNTLVCESMEDAVQLAFAEHRRKVVTKNGSVITKSGIITAGGKSSLQSRASRVDSAELDRLKQQRDKLRDQLMEMNRKLRNVATQQQQQSEVEGLKARLKFASMDLTLTKKKLESARNELKRIEEAQTRLGPDKEQLESSITARKGEIETLEARIFAAEDAIFAEFCRTIGVANIREYEEKHLTEIQSRAERALEISATRAKLENQLEYERSRNLGARLEQVQNDVDGHAKSLESVRREESKLREKLQAIRQTIAELEKQRDAKKDAFDEKEVRVVEFKKKQQSLAQEIADLHKQITYHEGQLEQLHARRHGLFMKAKLEGISIPFTRGSLDDVAEGEASQQSQESDSMDVEAESDSQLMEGVYALESELLVDFSSVPRKLRTMTAAEQKAQHQEFLQEINKRQLELEKMDPNMKAASHFKNVQARFKKTAEACSAARQGALAADRAFKEVAEKRTRLFMEAFSRISAAIDPVYKELTATADHPGGTAYLSVDNHDMPYLGGVKFTAMPANKRFRDMEQLSGGEKTVAALALLLAIQRFKPSPFCVLDEIDAALDKANVARVTRYLKKHSDELQFVVISLNNRFFEHSDSLIGIMVDLEEQSSKPLTLDLSNYPE